VSSDGRLLSTLVLHTDSVLSFVPVPVEAGMKSKSCVISISKDGSVCVIDLEDFRWYTFSSEVAACFPALTYFSAFTC
jgi:hypothetical protein